MAPQRQEQQILGQPALMAIGRVLRQEFQNEKESERMRELLAELRPKGKTTKRSDD